MSTRIITVLVLFVVGLAILGAAAPQLKVVSPAPTSPASGQQMFVTYCAVCHGKDAKGGGPAASALRTPPPDLTTLTARNNGKYPELRVYGLIRGDVDMPAHGSKDMPVWGRVFQSMSHDNGAETQMRVSNITAYIKTLQQK